MYTMFRKRRRQHYVHNFYKFERVLLMKKVSASVTLLLLDLTKWNACYIITPRHRNGQSAIFILVLKLKLLVTACNANAIKITWCLIWNTIHSLKQRKLEQVFQMLNDENAKLADAVVLFLGRWSCACCDGNLWLRTRSSSTHGRYRLFFTTVQWKVWKTGTGCRRRYPGRYPFPSAGHPPIFLNSGVN